MYQILKLINVKFLMDKNLNLVTINQNLSTPDDTIEENVKIETISPMKNQEFIKIDNLSSKTSKS